jgi:hypothetical protein
LDWIHSEYTLVDLNSMNQLMQLLKIYPLGSIKGICWANENIQIDLFKKAQSTLPGFRFITIQINVRIRVQRLHVVLKCTGSDKSTLRSF